MATILHTTDVFTPSPQEIDAARRLEAKLDGELGARVEMAVNVAGETHTLPEHTAEFFRAVIHEIALGHRIGLVDLDEEMSTTAAAEFLGISRPTLVGLLKEGRIPHRMVGTHRRVPRGPLVQYREQNRATQTRSLEERLQDTDDLLREWHAAETRSSP